MTTAKAGTGLVDWALALGLTGLAEAQLGVFVRCCDTAHQVIPTSYPLTLALTLPVAWRRRFPVPILFFMGAVAVSEIRLNSPVTDFGLLAVAVVLYTVAAQSSRKLVAPIAVATPFGIAAAIALDGWQQPYEVTLIYLELAGALVLGELTRRRRRESAEQAARVELEREHRAREAAASERWRIARELHDVVSHSLSVIAVQAGAARTVMHTAPERMGASLLAIETVSREAWAEVRQFLDVAGRDAGSGEAPRSGLAHLSDLIERFEGTGLSIDLVITGDARPLAADADLCAYRVVQESLTNTLRHSARQQRQARVSISYGDGSVEVEIAGGGRGGPAAAQPRPAGDGHHGLAGMSERVRLAGGELSVEDGRRGFVVRALLPVSAAAS